MRLLQLLHEAKPSSITGVIGLYLQLDSRIMPRNKCSRIQTSIYCASIYRAPPFTGRANYFLANSGFMSKLRFIVNLFTLPVYIHSKSTTVKLLFTVLPFTVPLRGLLFFPKYKIPGSWVINVNCDSIYRTPLNTVLFCLSPRGAINGGLTVILMLSSNQFWWKIIWHCNKRIVIAKLSTTC